MTSRKLDMSVYPRKAHFDYFRSLAYPYVGLTANVDVTVLAERARKNQESFFLHVLYAVGKAANEIPEFRQRIAGEEIVEFDNCPTSHTVMKPDGTYAYCEADPSLPWPVFLRETVRRQEDAIHDGSIEETGDPRSLLFISCLPWLNYTALQQPVPCPADSNPRITWGRYGKSAGRLLMPVTVLANHALVDGRQIADFYERLNARIL